MVGAFSVHGFNEQIFGAKQQVRGRGQSDKEVFGPTVSPLLVQSGKGRIASDPPLLNLPRPSMAGVLFAFMAPTNKSLAQMSKSPKVAAALVQKMHLDQGTP